jgi:redox-sensitive bicupin YhaK (pirin superfamily)
MFDETIVQPDFITLEDVQHFPADVFPTIHPIHWLHSHFAVGGWSPLQRLSGMITAHMTRIAPRNGFTWHPHRGLEIYTWVLEGTLYHEDTTGGRGEIGPGELQRMFSGDWIEHQELNLFDDPVRVIQIWYMADPKYRGLSPHYQQLNKSELPHKQEEDATVTELIGGRSSMDQHIQGRLTATTIPSGGRSSLIPPEEGEDLFLYITDGNGRANGHRNWNLGQYDVILSTTNANDIDLIADGTGSLSFLSFYLPSFLS